MREGQRSSVLDIHVPVDDSTGQPLHSRAGTVVLRKRGELENLDRLDDRAAPRTGTALGVIQATNTWTHLYATNRGASRPERNLLHAVTGAISSNDRAVANVLHEVLSA